MNKILLNASLALVVLVQVGNAYGSTYTPENVLDESFTSLDQGWDNEDREVFYHDPQGSPILPYKWFLALEQDDSSTLFRDEENMSSFGLINWGKSDSNPDGLPIGLTKDLGIYGVESKLGMNCASCHVAQVTVNGKKLLIDGGSSHFDFSAFMNALLKSMDTTYNDTEKFEKFAKNIGGASITQEDIEQLHARFRGVLEKRHDWDIRNNMTVVPGPGRVDALNIIMNQTTAHMLARPDNARPVGAPVSLPFLWDAPYLDYVQYNAVVPNAGPGAIARNIGQVLGVFGEVSIIDAALPIGYASSVNVKSLQDLEGTMQSLYAPSWNEGVAKGVFPKLDSKLLKSGEQIYNDNCSACHQVIDPKKHGDLASIKVSKIPLSEIGTDPTAALSFVQREVNSGPLFGRKAGYVAGNPLCEKVYGNQLLGHMTVGVLLNQLGQVDKKLITTTLESTLGSALTSSWDHLVSKFEKSPKAKLSDQRLISHLKDKGASEKEITVALEKRSNDSSALYSLLVENELDSPTKDLSCLGILQEAVYKARPLDGIWVTGPYLHNGSVASIRSLLKPAPAREKTFTTGSIELDLINIGFKNETAVNTFVFDTTLPGNSNSGHEYGTSLSGADTESLLEYIKSL
jgi:hypothetical protein|tara:strand:+ start:971 stop:2860 length:1890 start_codon:yes stop_codon:yes gene_type:complete